MYWTYCHTHDFSAQQLEQAYAHLSASRKAHIDRLRKPEDKKRSLVCGLLVQQLLQQHYGITDAVLHRHANGSPYLSGCDLHVSLTHCDGLVACAISREPVGIDLERIRPIRSRVLDHVCTPEEAAWVLGGIQPTQTTFTEPQILQRFYEIWTAKEAFFKKQGTGITDLKSVNVLHLDCQTHHLGAYMVKIL